MDRTCSTPPRRCPHPLVIVIALLALAACRDEDLGRLVPARSAATPTVFRMEQLSLRDPHVFMSILTCSDLTDGGVLGSPSFNSLMNDAITLDQDGDGWLDLSLLVTLRPLDQAGAGGNAELGFGLCDGSGTCEADPALPPTPCVYANETAGLCLEPLAGTVKPYSPAVTVTTPPCFATDPRNLAFLRLSGTLLPLEGVRVAATYVGDPADSLLNGLMMGFLPEAVATTFTVDLGPLGLQALSSLLQPGGCGSGDDMDVGPDGVTAGWWLYFNFYAVQVDYLGA